mmetsp:Transcript_9251/g.24199  ORF Transcript_9251/g.24199 Transcript_9251/m.24199 type:complete len:660 (+) Transcript_9251:169-2148(+)
MTTMMTTLGMLPDSQPSLLCVHAHVRLSLVLACSDFGVPARPTPGPLDGEDDDDDDDEFSEFAVPATLSAPITDFDASPKATEPTPFPSVPSPAEDDLDIATGLANAHPARVSDEAAADSSQGSHTADMQASIQGAPGDVQADVEKDAFGDSSDEPPPIGDLSDEPLPIQSSLQTSESAAAESNETLASTPLTSEAPLAPPEDGENEFDDLASTNQPGARTSLVVAGDDADEFGGFAESSPAAAPSSDDVFGDEDDEDEDDGFGGFTPATEPARANDDEFGDFVDTPRALGAPALPTADDDDDFGGFADATSKQAGEDDDDFGDFDSGGVAGTDDFDEFSSASAQAPPAELLASPAAATSSTLIPASAIDGSDAHLLKQAAVDVLQRVLPESCGPTTGVTGCPTLDVMLSQQAPSSEQPPWHVSIWHAPDKAAIDARPWVDSVVEQGLLHSLGMPPRDQDATVSQARESPPPAASKMQSMGSPSDAPAAVGSMPTHEPFAAASATMPTMEPMPIGSTFGGDDPFGAFTSTPAPPATLAAPPGAASMQDDFGAFGGFDTSASAPPPAAPSLPPGVGVAPLEFDLSQLGASTSSMATLTPMNGSGDVLSSSMQQLGMDDMFASLESVGSAPAPAGSQDAWLAKLPDLSFVLNPSLDRPMVM